MSTTTKIEWTRGDDGVAGATWNPVTGCRKVSPGCDNCYAETFAERWRGVSGHPFEQGFDVRLWPERLTLPLRWRKPRRVFVNSMSDLFIDDVGDEFVAAVFATMVLTPQHTYQILTKRPGRMRSLLNSPAFRGQVVEAVLDRGCGGPMTLAARRRADLIAPIESWSWPLPNVWLGASVETQRWAQVRLPLLAETPAVVRFASCEPLLGALDIRPWLGSCLDWVIAGGESGPKARPMHPDWAKSLRDQCRAAGVAFFFKQLGTCWEHSAAGRRGSGADPQTWPAQLRVREYPTVPGR